MPGFQGRSPDAIFACMILQTTDHMPRRPQSITIDDLSSAPTSAAIIPSSYLKDKYKYLWSELLHVGTLLWRKGNEANNEMDQFICIFPIKQWGILRQREKHVTSRSSSYQLNGCQMSNDENDSVWLGPVTSKVMLTIWTCLITTSRRHDEGVGGK